MALQLGGSEPADLAHCARLGEQWGYDEINLNCGCPSERVQRGAFGACLMNEPQLVADCVKAMVDVVQVPVTVKHRIGIDKDESYGFVRDFIGTVAAAGCKVFIVHARNAWLKGLSPKENREVPPLRYAVVHQLKRDFPHLTIAINGGIQTDDVVHEQLDHLDGVMVGREAYHNPWWLARWDALYYGAPESTLTREDVEAAMVAYMAREAAAHGTPLGQHCPAHAGPAPWTGRVAPLAPSVERSSSERIAAARGHGHGARRACARLNAAFRPSGADRRAVARRVQLPPKRP